MNTREILEVATKTVGITHAAAAKLLGWVPQQLNARLSRGSMRSDELLAMLDAMGIDVVLRVRETGKEIRPRITGAGRRVRCMVDHVTYDTNESTALSNNFYADGVNEYTDGKAMELYMDKAGRYFFAEYSSWEGGKDRISPVTADEAAKFISKYGTQIHKEPPQAEEPAEEPTESEEA